MNIDAVAALRCWAVQLQLGGRDYRIPPLPASDWLEAIIGPYHRIVPGMVQDDTGGREPSLSDQILDGVVPWDECHAAARDAIATVSGMKWWSATRLTVYLMSHWGTIGGAVLGRGMDPTRASLGAVLTLAYRVMLENCKDEQERQRLDMELEKPPLGVLAAQAYDARQATTNFMALGSALNG